MNKRPEIDWFITIAAIVTMVVYFFVVMHAMHKGWIEDDKKSQLLERPAKK